MKPIEEQLRELVKKIERYGCSCDCKARWSCEIHQMCRELDALLAAQAPADTPPIHHDKVTPGMLPKDNVERSMMHGMNCPASALGNDEECLCGLKWRVALATEQTMHNAWRKRAEQAEKELADAVAAERERCASSELDQAYRMRSAFHGYPEKKRLWEYCNWMDVEVARLEKKCGRDGVTAAIRATPASEPQPAPEPPASSISPISEAQASVNLDKDETQVYEPIAPAPADTQPAKREKVHETIGYETDYMRGRREMREEIADGSAPVPAPATELCKECGRVKLECKNCNFMDFLNDSGLCDECEALEPQATPSGDICECGQPRNSIRHSGATAKSVDAHAFKPAKAGGKRK